MQTKFASSSAYSPDWRVCWTGYEPDARAREERGALRVEAVAPTTGTLRAFSTLARVTLPSIDFRSIREHRGTKSGGFEELVYQLIPCIDEGVAGHEIVRHGTPDGGVEAHVEFDDGSIWGWQAKYFDRIDDSQLQQMKDSLDSALKSYPTLSKYTFVIPLNPPSGKPRRGKSAKQKLDDAFDSWKSSASANGRGIDIHLVDESRLLQVLVNEQHAGLVYYWFDARLLFGRDWQRKSVKAAVDAAGPRYTAEVNVDLPVSFAFEGLGRTEVFEDRLAEHVAEVADSTRRLQSGQVPGLADEIAAEVVNVTTTIENLVSVLEEVPIAGSAPLDWEEHVSGLRGAWQRLDTLHMELYQREDALGNEGSRAGSTPRKSPWEAIQALRPRVLGVRHAVDDLIGFLNSPAPRLAAAPLLFLSGDAGTGKTHLLCDVAERRVKEGRPTVLVMGQQIGEGNPRTLVPDQLGLEGMNMEEFLSALNTAGEVAGTRALLMVDAINEGGGLTSWPPHLRSLCAEVLRYPYLGLVLSCRSSYVEAMLDAESGQYEAQLGDIGLVGVKHGGFAGSEWPAARRFFEHYGLPLPDFPLLIPEYTNPLFLKLLCESLRKAGETTLPRGATGITAIFERFLGQVNRSLARPDHCDFPQEAALVSQVVATVAAALLSTKSDRISLSDYQGICEGILGSRGWEKSLAKGLLDEGVFALDVHGREQVVRLSYQRLDHHLQAAQLLRTHDAEGVRAFLAELEKASSGFYQRSGLLEALAVQLPEKLGCELHELVTDAGDDVVQAAFLESVVWRDPKSFPEDLDYLNSIIERGYDWYGDQVLDTLLQVACVPGHALNAETLHLNLSRTRLPDRDAWWTTYINASSREDSVVYRIVDWARSEGQAALPDDVARLAAITLTWFLAASNRELRDCATKALVTLLRRRTPALVDLLRRFESVDDPYVAERLYAVAYSCALSTADRDALQAISAATYDSVFASGKSPAHILLRDYARGVIEAALDHGAIAPHVNIEFVRPPYESPWPVRIPTRETLQRLAPESTHRHLWISLDGILGDFANYEVEHAVSHFEAPNQRRRRRKQREKVRRGQGLSAKAGEPVMWTGSEAARWIFRRVLRLGWTPARFGGYDDMVASRGRHPDDDRTERIGKKYQWIAYHELLAVIADNCHFKPWFSDQSGPYAGPWQLSLRDIDPTLTSAPLKEPAPRSPVTWWQPLHVSIDRFPDERARNKWSTDEADVPGTDELLSLLRVADTDDSTWLTLQGRVGWEEDAPRPSPTTSVVRGELWLQVRSYVIPRDAFGEFKRWAHLQDWYGRWMPEGPATGDTYLGEWPWHPSAAVGDDLPLEVGNQRFQVKKAPANVRPTWAEYHWEGDGSLVDGVNRVLPAGWLVRRAGLRWRAGAFAFDDQAGRVAAFDPSATESGPSALLFREESLRTLLDREDCSLVWTVLGEKNVLGGDFRPRPILAISGIAGLESGSADLEVALRTVVHQPE